MNHVEAQSSYDSCCRVIITEAAKEWRRLYTKAVSERPVLITGLLFMSWCGGWLLQGSNLVAAGYCLYSSSMHLVFTLGNGVVGFTYDQQVTKPFTSWCLFFSFFEVCVA